MKWNRLAKNHAIHYAHRNGFTTERCNKHILADSAWKHGFWPKILNNVSKLDIRWHSRNNLISSQVFAINTFEGLYYAKTGLRLLDDISGQLKPEYEWVDSDNSLCESRRSIKSNIDVIILSKMIVRVYEIKYAENKPQPCSSKHQDKSICEGGMIKILKCCPLKMHYNTKYMECIGDPQGPIYAEKLFNMYSPKCPALHGELYQFIRLVALKWIKEQSDQRPWSITIAYPYRNEYVSEQVNKFKSCLREPEILLEIDIEDIVQRARSRARNQLLRDWGNYMKCRYFPDKPR